MKSTIVITLLGTGYTNGLLGKSPSSQRLPTEHNLTPPFELLLKAKNNDFDNLFHNKNSDYEPLFEPIIVTECDAISGDDLDPHDPIVISTTGAKITEKNEINPIVKEQHPLSLGKQFVREWGHLGKEIIGQATVKKIGDCLGATLVSLGSELMISKSIGLINKQHIILPMLITSLTKFLYLYFASNALIKSSEASDKILESKKCLNIMPANPKLKGLLAIPLTAVIASTYWAVPWKFIVLTQNNILGSLQGLPAQAITAKKIVNLNNFISMSKIIGISKLLKTLFKEPSAKNVFFQSLSKLALAYNVEKEMRLSGSLIVENNLLFSAGLGTSYACFYGITALQEKAKQKNLEK